MSKLEIYPENFSLDEYKIKYLGEGDTFKCYLTSNNKVYKEAKAEYNLLRYKKSIEKQLKMKSKHFAFPETIIYNQQADNKYTLNGFLTPYIKGAALLNLSGNEQLHEVIDGFKKFEKALEILTSKKIRSNDLHAENLFFTEDKKIVAIDTMNFQIDQDITLEDQIADINADIDSAFFDQLSLIKDYSEKSVNINKIFKLSLDGKIKTSEFLFTLKDFYEKETSTEIKTVKQMKIISKKLAN